MKKEIEQRHPDSQLETLFLEELRELYGAEKQQILVLPLLKKAASSLKLRNVLASHLDDTKEQLRRLEAIFCQLGHPAEAHAPETIFGITREAEQVIASTNPETATRDAGLIVAAQKLDHYEITSYGSLATHARTLDLEEIEELLELSLYEEKENDDLLTALAENYINAEARRE
jgi:ferritin-like metal-binding protein YciE